MDNAVKDFIKSKYEELGDTFDKHNIIIAEVKRKFDLVITRFNIYDLCERTKKLREVIKDLNKTVEEKKLYEVVGNEYHFIKDGKLYKIPVTEIDEMFYDFSNHGGKLSSEEMLVKYQLKPEVWHMIKNRLRLYKASNVISPYTAENTPQEELEEKITEANIRHIDTIKGKMVLSHEKLFLKESNKAIKTLSNIDYFLENVQKFIKDYKPKEIQYTEYKDAFLPPLTIGITDFHFGKQGTGEIITRMGKIRDYILSQPNTEINIISLGDLAECFIEGGMHPGQIEGMEMHGVELMLFISNIFETFLSDLYTAGKKVNFTGIGGNHDRLGRTHSDDMARTGAVLVYELIKRGISKSEIEVNILREKINSFDLGEIRFIIAHGDDGFSNRKIDEIMWKNGDNRKYNVVLHGDKHTIKMQETKNGVMIGIPALAGSGEYDRRLDLHSEPAFLVIEPNQYNTVDILLRRLP